MDGHYEGRIIFLLGRFVFVVVVGAFLSICTPQAQKVGLVDLKRSQYCSCTDTSKIYSCTCTSPKFSTVPVPNLKS